MNKIFSALAIAAGMLLISWLGAREMISQNMSHTLLIVLPGLWVASLGRRGHCPIKRKPSV